jgi:uncharacterized protein (TIGR03435 family)
VPPDTTKEQFRMMLQNVLAERLKLSVHRETKELPVYALTVTRDGPKMKLAPDVPRPTTQPWPRPPSPLKLGPDGFPVVPMPPSGISRIFYGDHIRIIGEGKTMHDVADQLTIVFQRPVKDETTLTAKYDFTLNFTPEGTQYGSRSTAGAGSSDESDPGIFIDIFSAVQKQLGLKVESKKGPIEMIVVDHAVRTPTPN